MAHIQKRGNKYQARYRAPDGKERSKRFERKVDAERWLATQTADMHRGAWVDPQRSKVTFDEWAEEWKRSVTGVRASTKDLNVGVLANHLLPRFADFTLEAIRPSDVRAMIAAKEEEGYSTSMVRRCVMVLSLVLQAAVKDDRLARNVCEAVDLPAEETGRMRFLDHDQVRRLVEAHPSSDHYAPLVYTAAYVGLRWGELAGLRVENVQFLRRRILIVEQLREVNGSLTFGDPKTDAGRRSVYVPGTIMDLLGAHAASEVVQESGLMFPTVTGKPLRRSNYRRRYWKRAVEQAFAGDPLADLTFHELRHTAASLAIQEGAHPKVLQQRLGHSSIQTTLDRYGHLFDSTDEQLAEALDARLREAHGDLMRTDRGQAI